MKYLNKKFKGKALCSVYLDDFLVTSLTEKDCALILKELRLVLKEIGLVVEEDKSSQKPSREVEYLGFLISRDTISL